MGLSEIFKKQGGVKLLKQYWKNGAFFTAIGQFLLLGKSRTALEILRLSTSLKTKQKLEKKYRKKLEEFDRNWEEEPHQRSNKIWICWLQGMDSAPEVVQKCYHSVVERMPDREIVVITYDNMKDYVQFPMFIQDKMERRIISGAHLADLLRLELLLRYGGTWIDATVYCSGSDIPDYMLNSELFMFQNLKPGRDGHAIVVSNWFITAYSNNKILAAVRYLLYAYWKTNNELMDYYVFHDFFQIIIDKYDEEWNKVVPFNNATPHIILLRLFETYDEEIWDAVMKQTPFHKLTYKFDNEKKRIEGTYYRKLFG